MIKHIFRTTLPAPFLRSELLTYYRENSPAFPHMHQSFQLSLVLRGKFYVKFSAVDIFSLSKGDLLIIAPEVKHFWYSSKDETTEVFSVFCEGLSENIFGNMIHFFAPYIKGTYWKVKCPLDKIQEQLNNVIDVINSKSQLKQGHLFANHCSIMLQLGETLLAQHKAPEVKISQSLISSLFLIERKYSQTLSLDDLAQAANLSKSHLSTLFNLHFGKAPMHYLNYYRLGKAKDLLLFTELPIYEVACQCGFSSIHYFCRLFRKSFEMSPTAYRKEAELQSFH